ncbi:MAG: hypothetical protein ACLP2U_05430 [Syntrophobacteraceae bacterium]
MKMEIRREMEVGYNFLPSKAAPSQYMAAPKGKMPELETDMRGSK